jgi:cell pole-organizing protein PopZ
MPNPNTAHEPSMEEILASIRQIISEDADEGPAEALPGNRAERADANGHATQPAAPPASAETSDRPGGSMKQATSEAPARTTQVAAVTDPASRSEIETVPRDPRPAPAQRPSANEGDTHGLLSRNSDAAVSGAFNALAHTILAQNARTLEGLVSDMVRPMLKDWLDENLPSLVERLVREEIERVSRGRR